MNPLNEENLIVIDVETTGLDPDSDHLTEIAALRVIGGEVSDKFVTLVNPGVPIPYPIQRLTGISDEMVAGAPPEKEALQDLHDFLRTSTILGQNVDFDIDFINKRSVRFDLPVWSGSRIDTKTAASVLFPRLIGHGLGVLTEAFRTELENHHRAEADAVATLDVAKVLWEKLLSLSPEIFGILRNVASSSGDVALMTWVSAAEKSGLVGKARPPEVRQEFIARFDNILGNPADPEKSSMSEDEVIAFLGPESPFANIVESYTVRDVQIQMAQAVFDSLNYGMFLVVEAGTGTGKSFAYLLPAIAYSSAKGDKVVVSTKTKNLQEQLFFKDLPALYKALPFDFRAVLLKGRGNYLCKRRLKRLLADFSVLRYDERAALTKLIVWASETKSGDIAEANSFQLNKYPGVWARIRSESATCLGNRCPFRKQCFVQKIRSAVVDAQIVVVNHALLFAEIADSAVLGDYKHAIIDEAHNLEEVAAEFFGDQITTWNFAGPLHELIQDSITSGGLLPELFEYVSKNFELPEEFYAGYESCVSTVRHIKETTESVFVNLTNRLDLVYNWRQAEYSIHQRFHPREDVFEVMKTDLIRLAKSAVDVVDKASMILAGLPNEEDDNLERITREIAGQLEKLSAAADALLYMTNPVNPDAVYWWESPPRQESIDSRICWAPLDVAERMYNIFHTQKKSAVFTSATMSVAGEFDYILGRLGLDLLDPERVIKMLLGSPYDFASQLLVLFPDFIPEPQGKDYFPAIAEIITRVSGETRAGALALFTSYKALKYVYSVVAPELSGEGILVLAQGISGGRSQLTQRFIGDKESVLFGTESFWQGVDVRGEALQLLFLTRLPFTVPTDPYFAGQCERIRRIGGDPFGSYTVPQAVIKFRQGIGRLIRGEEDIGVLILCDRRIGTRAYGRMFIDSLPVEVERVYSLQELITKIKRFL
ncbi:hypothetical protein DRQ36_01010 [bacterium]|nr:MAG: hypothetical protein DRQ36_01010 [bacterium]